MPLPTAPRSAMQSTAAAPAVPSEAAEKAAAQALKAVEDEKAAKAAKKQEKLEAERKAKEAKEAAAAAAAAAVEQAKTDLAMAHAAAEEAVATGLKGSSLLAHVNGLATKPSGAALLKSVLAAADTAGTGDVTQSKWWVKEEYGEALTALLQTPAASAAKQQLAALYVVQGFCHSRKFPKVDIKGKPHKVIEVIFALLMNNDMVEPDVYVAWADDENPIEEAGRVTAIVQSTTFVQSIREADVEEFDEDEEQEEIDEPRQTV
jgi:hypothetical protein